MPDQFPILQLTVESPEVIEQLGSKPKFWFRRSGDEQPWLFKFTREHTGEDWSEKIAAEMAALLGVKAARVELAKFMNKRGCASRSFVETKKGFGLIHGSEVLAGRVLGYEKSKRWHQCNHSIKNIIAAVRNTFPAAECDAQLDTLAGFFILDAIICNTDRHHDNWAILRGPSAAGHTIQEIAPSFDHASSLGRELRNERRKLLLATDTVEKYILNGHGGIYWQERDTKGENPFVLALKAAKEFPKYFEPWLRRVRSLQYEDLTGVVARIPDDWMELEAKQLSVKLMTMTVDKLKAVRL
jgi:hypothetical protein